MKIETATFVSLVIFKSFVFYQKRYQKFPVILDDNGWDKE